MTKIRQGNSFSTFIGFTLIETLLVLVIISIIIYASIGYMQQRAFQMRIDRTSTQMQQILNAGLSYYVMNGKWPGTPTSKTQGMTDLKGGFLPDVTMNNPWGNTYSVVPDTTNNLLYVYTSINVVSGKNQGAFLATTAVSGTLPLAFTSRSVGTNPAIPNVKAPCQATDTVCYVAAAVNIPGQNLNNATSVNYAGLYHHGACVPVPSCPVDNTGKAMTPQIYVTASQVSGTTNKTNPNDVYPITSFTAYAKPPGNPPAMCDNNQNNIFPAQPCGGSENSGSPTNQYWRVCLQLYGQNQIATGDTWGKNQTLLAITRCVLTNEKQTGSSFNVWGN